MSAVLLPPAEHLSPELLEILGARCEAGRHGLVLDLDALERRYATAVAAAALHDVRLLCAVKASTVPDVLSLAARHGLGFDVANTRELAAARAAAPDAAVSLTSPALGIEERPALHDAFARGEIRRWHADSLAQLDELARACRPGSAVGVRVSLDGLEIPEGMPLYRPSRFGIRLSELPAAREIAAAQGCSLRWLHAHNGSEENDTASYVFAAEQIVAAAAASGIALEALDLGGGLVLDATVDGLGEFFGAVRAATGPDLELTFEPGRFWMTDTMALVTRVLDVKPAAHRAWLVLDLGLMSHLQWAYELRYPVLGQIGAGADGAPLRWQPVGRSCFEEDMLDDDEVVPVAAGAPIPAAGDWIVLGNITGYTIELACDFNGIGRPALEIVRSGRRALAAAQG